MMQRFPPLSDSAALSAVIHPVTRGRNATASGGVKPTLPSLQGNSAKSCPGTARRAAVLSPHGHTSQLKVGKERGKSSLREGRNNCTLQCVDKVVALCSDRSNNVI